MSSSSSAAAAASPSSLPSRPKQLSKDEFVEYFTLLRKTNPSLTAQEFFAIVHKDHEAAQQQHQQQQQQTVAASTNAASTTTTFDATPTAVEKATPFVPDVTVNPVLAAALDTHADSAAASASFPTSSSASPVVVNNLIRSKLFAPSSPAPAANPAVLPTTTTPDSSQASSSTMNAGSSVASTPTANTAPISASANASPPDVLATTSTPPMETGISTPPTTADTDNGEAAAASTATTAPAPRIINIANLKDEMDKERERLKQYIHQQNVLRYQEFKREAEENARQREEIENVFARVRPVPPPPAMALQRGAGAGGGGLAAGALPAPARRGIPERIGDGLRFLGQMDLFDMLLRYGLFALLISNGSWHVFFIIVACLCGYSIISYLLSLIEFRRGQAPQADPAAAAAPPTRQRRPQDCSTAFRVWYICFKLFLLFFVSFLPWFKVEGLRRELHYEGVLYYPEDHLAAENPAPVDGEGAGNNVNNQGEGPVPPQMEEEQDEEAVAAQ